MSLRGDDHQSGHRADHQGVDEGAQHGHGPLAHGIIGLGSGVGNRSTAQTGFVGKDAALEAHQHDLAEGAPSSSLTTEGVAEDRGQSLWNGAGIGQQNHQAGTDVQD